MRRKVFEQLDEVGEWVRAILLIIAYGVVTFLMSSYAHASEPQIKQGPFLTSTVRYAGHSLRAGLYLEKDFLKGCVIYLEGLGDSILNHEPLFRSLSDNGFRIITFDYFGQGGSSGSMNETRLDSGAADHQIKNQAKAIWTFFSDSPDPVRGLNCAGSRKLVIGWSTGGLAAYQLANDHWADAVVLLAPGINIRLAVGESSSNWLKLSPWRLVANPAGGLPRWSLNHLITQSNLTRATFAEGSNPHIDPIKPTSPMQVPLFASDLIAASQRAHYYKIDASVKGLIALSGANDSYVDRTATLATLRANASHFDTVAYRGALHELDNELPSVQADLFARIVRFLDTNR